MKQLAFIMSLSLGQTVVDQSGLNARYDCEANWWPQGTPLHPHSVILEDQSGGASYERSESDLAPPSLTLEAALKDQLGLVLSSTETVRGKVLIVDAAQEPSEGLETQPAKAPDRL
jgi:uncharacterized protein (TIGR03435 family)